MVEIVSQCLENGLFDHNWEQSSRRRLREAVKSKI